MHAQKYDVAIIGAGFGGVCVAYHLSRKRTHKLSIALIDPHEKIGAGVAYGTECIEQILNVPASKMSISDDASDSFIQWLQKKRYEYHSDSFVPRIIYQRYLSEMIDSSGSVITHIKDEAVRLEYNDGIQKITLKSQKTLFSSRMVLALGNLPYRKDFFKTSRVLNPWKKESFNSALKKESVAILGSGLSAVDVIVTLEAKKFSGIYTIISHHGRLPMPHEDLHEAPSEKAKNYAVKISEEKSILQAFRLFKQALNSGIAYASLIDALRPYTQSFWYGLEAKEKKRFLRHLRHLWDVHRHRIPQESNTLLSQLIDNGRLKISCGGIREVNDSDEGVEVVIENEHEKAACTYGAVFDCLGLGSNIYKSHSPLIQSLLEEKTVLPDELKIGIKADLQGKVKEHLYVIGPLRRGELWESTAVREIRAQAKVVAEMLV